GATLYVDTGNYALLESLTLSGTATRGFGIDEGFVMTGPTQPGHTASLFPIVPNERQWALLDLSDTDFVTISNLQLRDANRGVLMTGGEEAVEFDNIEAFGHVNEGIYVSQLNAPLATWTGLNVHDNGQTGLYVSGTLGGIDQLKASHNHGSGGLYADGSLGFLTNSQLTDNSGYGAYLYYPGAPRVQGNLFQGNSNTGLNFNVGGSTQALVGSTDLAAGLGNRFLNNGNGGAYFSGNALVVGNVASGNLGNGVYGIGMSGGEMRQNVVYGNSNGVYMYSGTVAENRVYNNVGTGIWLSTATATGNTTYSNTVGLYAQGNSVLRSNLVYANATVGVQLNGSSSQFIGNTVYQTTGDAVQLYGSASNARFIDNILWAGAGGVALNVDANSQNGFTSNFNIFQGAVGIWQGTQRATLTAWRQANFQDLDSQATDPLFVDIDGADGKLGYFSVA
ncbi:MAG: right-handed parallel beta-helix repeat-containing protein, partial [Burkholderiales bacterium]|nr:right-handed parallel beta-helix repeat-containing protein [Burkholderiales bacterium]